MKLNQLETAKSLPFILSGKSTLTVKSLQSGKHFTYSIRKPKDKDGIWFVKTLVGTDDRYQYFGFIANGKFRHGNAKAKIGADAPSVKAFEFVFDMVSNGRSNNNLELFHSGVCGRCGRKLTNPESLITGIGPDCASRM